MVLFKKKEKEKVEFPYEYCIILWTEQALREGVGEDMNKKIERYKGGVLFRTYQYSEELFEILKEEMAIFDMTESKIRIPIIGRLSPETIMIQSRR